MSMWCIMKRGSSWLWYGKQARLSAINSSMFTSVFCKRGKKRETSNWCCCRVFFKRHKTKLTCFTGDQIPHLHWANFCYNNIADLLTALSSNSFSSEMRKALRCCLFPLIIVKRWEQSAEWVSSCRKPLMMVLREESMDCCKLYDIFIPATAFICKRRHKKSQYFNVKAPVGRDAIIQMPQLNNKIRNLQKNINIT